MGNGCSTWLEPIHYALPTVDDNQHLSDDTAGNHHHVYENASAFQERSEQLKPTFVILALIAIPDLLIHNQIQ